MSNPIHGLLSWLSGKEPACQTREMGLIPGSGRFPGEGNGNPLQYSCLGNPMDGEEWWATVHGSQRIGHNLTTEHLHTHSYVHAHTHTNILTVPHFLI